MSTARADFAAVRLDFDAVLLIGGETSSTTDTSTVEVYQPRTGAIKQIAPMKTARSGHTATLLRTGKILVAGGSSTPNGPALATAEIYDPSSNTWSDAAPMAQARAHQAAVLMTDGRVFVAGGEGGASTPDPTGNEVYDPGTNTWTSVQAAFGDRPNGPALAVLKDGRILIYGGAAVLAPGNQYEFYDPATGRESYGRTIPDSYNFTTSAVLPDGSVLFVGGRAGYKPAGPVNTTYLFDPALESFTAGPAMNVGHCHHTLTALLNGRLLVAGGGGCGGAPSNAVAELYDPDAKTWSPAGTMHAARGYHAAALLADGRVIVAGGFGLDGNPTATTEVYTPA